ncbi:hypothetical protein [Rheinheimera sp.]|uniref:hypothetical protein n=1 Tax=Rheinheimera sp. TaxID=1869214 RepID=UPI0023520D80|nr:hypothetical protein [Rheinheimera sp.]
MVLGNFSLSRLTFLFATLIVAACAQADIRISSLDDQCMVNSGGKSLALQLTPPCELVKVDYKDHDYYQYDKSKVYIVAGQAAPSSQLTKWSVKEEDRCSLQSQAVVVAEGKMRLSAVRENALTCPDIGLDEKVYRDFFESTKAN